MNFHVGVCPYMGQLSLYSETKNQIIDFNILKVNHDENEKINLMWQEILSKSNDKLGSVCVYLHDFYGSEIRKKFIEEGLKIGFTNVEIINFHTTLYLTAMSIINYKPTKGSVIWICCGSVFVWLMGKQKAKFIGEWGECSNLDDLENIVKESELSKGPDVVLHCYVIEKSNFTIISPMCKFFVYNNKSYISRGSLVKAQITAGNREVLHLETENLLSENVELHCGEIISFKSGQHLPITYSKQLTRKLNMIEVASLSRDTEVFKLPTTDEIYIKFKVDINEIYTVNFENNLEDSALNNDSSEIISETVEHHTINLSNLEQYNIPTITDPTILKINIAGIDLGTSRCCAAVNRRNGITTVPLDNTGERLLPSYVAYDEANVKCGRIVVNRLRYHSKSTIFDSKRIIGRILSDIEIDENWDFNLNFEHSKIYMTIKGFHRQRKITAEENAAELLKFIKRKTEEFQGTHLDKVIIAVPAAFTELQRIATIKAAELSGFDEIVLLPEPIAAAFAYFMDRPLPDNSNILLFDLGGGTLDVCIFKIENTKIKILSNTGDSKFGGRDFDTVLIDYFKNLLTTKYGISKLKDKKYKLMLECQRIKEELSTLPNSLLHVDEFDTDKQDYISITQLEFQNITKTLLNKVKNTIHSALFEASYKQEQINKVLLAGGGSRMPMIKDLLKEIFPKAEHCCEEHPDEVVAIGAAYFANNYFSE